MVVKDMDKNSGKKVRKMSRRERYQTVEVEKKFEDMLKEIERRQVWAAGHGIAYKHKI